MGLDDYTSGSPKIPPRDIHLIYTFALPDTPRVRDGYDGQPDFQMFSNLCQVRL